MTLILQKAGPHGIYMSYVRGFRPHIIVTVNSTYAIATDVPPGHGVYHTPFVQPSTPQVVYTTPGYMV